MCDSIFDFDIKIRKVLEILNNIAGGVNNKPREVMNVCLWVSEDVEMAEVIYETIMCLEG